VQRFHRVELRAPRAGWVTGGLVEMLTAIALLTAHLPSVVDWHDRHPSDPEDAR
jgi:hypothetical protein